MSEIQVRITDILKKFILETEKENIRIQRLILFGSYAKGTNNDYSDIDIAVVSEDFEGIRFYDNIKLDNAVLKSNMYIETHPFRPEDFNEDNPFVKEILQSGIPII